MTEAVQEAMKAIDGATSSKPDDAAKAVVASPGTIRKQNPAKQAVTKFFGGEPKDVALYVLNDVFLPAAKSMFVDMFEQGLERLVFGDTMDDRRRRRISGGNQSVRYDKISTQQSGRTLSRQARRNHDFDQIVYNTREDAESVLSHMYDYLDRYGVVRVSDLYALSNLTSEFTDRGWGWTDLRGSHIVTLREGSIIDFPPPVEIR